MNPIGLSSQFFDKPIALHRAALDEVLMLARTPYSLSIVESRDDRRREFGLVGGAAIIPVSGVLANDAPWWCDGTSYDWIRRGFDAALSADDVKAIVLEISSPGGTVENCFDLTDHIYNSRGQKPIHAILNENAYSAAYAIASACDRILVPRTGGTGSIGIVAAHMDYSKALSAAGYNITFIQYGARKTDGVAEKPLTDEALARFQADIDILGDMFVETVARNRGISAAKVRETEAGTFLGANGVTQGLADAVMAPDAAFRELLASLA
jgi:signal peptide peptidase SppA